MAIDIATKLQARRDDLPISKVTGLQTALDGKSAIGHGHAIADVTNLQSDLDGKVSTSRTITAGIGLTGGGNLSANRTINIDAATASNIRAGTTNKVVTSNGIESACELVSVSGGANLTPNWSSFIVNNWGGLSSNRTLNNPTNVEPGTTRYIFVRGNSSTARTVTFGSYYKGSLPTLNDITNLKWYLLTLVAYSTTHIVVAAVDASP